MAGGVLKILILAGRPGGDGGFWPLPGWLDRLERRGCRMQVLCLSKGSGLAADARAFEAPALGSRWLRGFAARALQADARVERPDLIHVLQDEMIDAVLALSDSAGLPYIQAVTDFHNL